MNTLVKLPFRSRRRQYSTQTRIPSELQIIAAVTTLVVLLLAVYYAWVFRLHSHHAFP